MAYIPESNSVVVFQSDPTKLVGTVSVVGVLPVTLSGNPSISGTVNIGTQSGSVVAILQGNASVITVIQGSVAVQVTPTANQSVSGTVDVSVIGTVPVTQATAEWTVKSSIAGGIFPISGSVAAVVTNFPTTQNVSGSVAAWLQSTNASVITVGSPVANQSISGTVQTDVRGSIAAVIIGGSIASAGVANQSVSGEVSVSNFPATQTVKSSITGGIFPISGSVAAVVTNNVTVVSSIAGGIFPISGSVAAVVTNFPTNQNVSGSVVAFQGAGWSGSVATQQIGTVITSLVSTVPSSVIFGASIFGLPPVNVTNTNLNVGGSVVAFQGAGWSGSVAAVRTGQSGTVITSISGSLSASIAGTVPVTQSGTWIPSVLNLTTRNDAVASFLGADLTYRPQASDSAGRTLTRPFAAEEARVEGYNSVVSTSVTTLVAAAGAGLKNYITDVVIANTGATTTLITFRSGGGTSVLGYGIAPAGGGSNMIGFAVPMRTLANETFDFQATAASSILFAKVSGFKAP